MTKIALITGASSGIGKELAIIHAQRGGDLVLVARSEDKLVELKNELADKYSVSSMVIAKDLTDENAPQEIYDQILTAGLSVDYLVNNAGFGGVGPFYESKLDSQVSMMNLNMVALVKMTHLFLQDFVKRNTGKILNVSSTASLIPGPNQAVYFATKAFVTSFSNALYQEMKDTKITVTNLMPGATETSFAEVSGMDKTEMFNQPASARSVAEAGYKGMLHGRLDVISGLTTSQKIMQAFLPITPKKVILSQIAKMQETK